MQSKYAEATAALRTGSGVIHTVILAGGSDAATVILDDSTDGSGSTLLKLSAVANGSAVASGLAIPFSTGCYATLSGTSPAVTVVMD